MHKSRIIPLCLCIVIAMNLMACSKAREDDNREVVAEIYGDISASVVEIAKDKETTASSSDNIAKSEESEATNIETTDKNDFEETTKEASTKEATTKEIVTKERTTKATEVTTEKITTAEVTTVANRSHKISVKCILQNPELPSGCEVTALAIVLNYYGLATDKCVLSDQYIETAKPGTKDLFQAFAGDPRDPYSYGCYAPVLLRCATKYLADKNSKFTAYNVSETDFDQLLSYIDKDIPVIIWNTEEVQKPSVGKEWIIDGKKVEWLKWQHCLVLTGYDINANLVYVADPMKGNVSYPLDTFRTRYIEMLKQAIVVY